MQVENKTVLITGGASGIGKIMTRLLLERKAKVIIWDINTQGIQDTIDSFAKLGSVFGYTVDIQNADEIKVVGERVLQEHQKVDILINNAGIIVGDFFHTNSQQDITKTMAINATAPMLITAAFLPKMLFSNSGHICNIASSGGLIANPKMAVYAASKWALIGWSDSLRLEMKQLKSNVNVTTVMPYYINTGMFDGVKSKIPILEAEAAALTIIKAIEKNKIRLTMPGYIYRITRLGQALFSINFFDWFTGDLLGIYKTMDNFTGRK